MPRIEDLTERGYEKMRACLPEAGVVALIAISLLIFLGVELLPGDLAEAILGQAATPETVKAFREQLQLDLPLPAVFQLAWRFYVGGRRSQTR